MPEHISLKHIFNEHAEIPSSVRYGAQGNMPISLLECVEIFASFANREGFDYYEEGCYARAHVMCRFLEDQGIAPAKIWAFADIEHVGELIFVDPLWSYVDEERGCHKGWNYHVAVCLPVLLEGQGIQNVVLDPTIMLGPATVQQWQGILHARNYNVEIVPFRTPTLFNNADYGYNTKTDETTDERAQRTIAKHAARTIDIPFVKHKSELMIGR